MAVILCQQGLRHLPGPRPTQACPSISADLSLQGAFPLGRVWASSSGVGGTVSPPPILSQAQSDFTDRSQRSCWCCPRHQSQGLILEMG